MADKITWIDRKSVLYHNKRMFKAGDVIPADILPASRIESLKKDKKIVIGEIKVNKSIKTVKLFDADIEAQVIQHEEKEVDKPKRQYNKRKAEDSDFVGDMMQEISEGDE